MAPEINDLVRNAAREAKGEVLYPGKDNTGSRFGLYRFFGIIVTACSGLSDKIAQICGPLYDAGPAKEERKFVGMDSQFVPQGRGSGLYEEHVSGNARRGR